MRVYLTRIDGMEEVAQDFVWQSLGRLDDRCLVLICFGERVEAQLRCLNAVLPFVRPQLIESFPLLL